jgi:hypothetical protein
VNRSVEFDLQILHHSPAAGENCRRPLSSPAFLLRQNQRLATNESRLTTVANSQPNRSVTNER